MQKTLDKIEKRYGSGAILRGRSAVKDVEKISTQCSSLDKLLDGGLPVNNITEIYGQEGCGKTTLAAHVVAEAQKNGGLCAYIDTEYAVNPEYFQTIGVDFDNENKFMLAQPTSGEEALGILEMLLESKEVSVIVLDSVAALVPQAVLDGEIEDQTIGQLARLMSKSMSRLTAKLAGSNTCVIFINQLRSNIGVMGHGPKYVTTGGKAVPYYSNVRIELSRIGPVKNGEDIIGSRIKAKVLKSKVSSPYRESEYDLIFGEGISSDRDLIEHCLKNGVITKGGAGWMSYGDLKVQGIEKFRLEMKANPELKNELYTKLMNNGVKVEETNG